MGEGGRNDSWGRSGGASLRVHPSNRNGDGVKDYALPGVAGRRGRGGRKPVVHGSLHRRVPVVHLHRRGAVVHGSLRRRVPVVHLHRRGAVVHGRLRRRVNVDSARNGVDGTVGA